MGNSINKLFEELDQTHLAHSESEGRIKDKLQARLNVTYTDWTALQNAIVDSDSSSEYTYSQYGDSVKTWFRFYGLSDVPEREREYLESYLSDECIEIDWDNDCLERNIGPCLIICDDGTVYDQDSGKTIITESDLEGADGSICIDERRNQLIEGWMERSGYFPCVLADNGRGDLFHVNTQKKAEVSNG